MPKYTARVFILFNGKVDEELLLDNFHAKGQVAAEDAVASKAEQYVTLQNDNSNKAYGYKVDFCKRTRVLEAELRAKKPTNTGLVPTTVNVPPTKKVTHITPKVKLISKFDSEEKGDFKDPFDFAPGIVRDIYYNY